MNDFAEYEGGIFVHKRRKPTAWKYGYQGKLVNPGGCNWRLVSVDGKTDLPWYIGDFAEFMRIFEVGDGPW